MSFPLYQSSVTAGDVAASTAVSIPAPAGTVSGDYQLVVLEMVSDTVTLGTTPAGWTLLANVIVQSNVSTTNTTRVALFESTTATGAFAMTLTGSRVWGAARGRWSLPSGSTGRTIAIGSKVEPQTATTSHVLPAVTTTATDSLVIGVGAVESLTTAQSWPSMGSFTSRVNAILGNSTEIVAIGIGDLQVATPTSGVAGTFTTQSASEAALFSIVLNGVASGPTAPTVNAGVDASVALNAAFNRTATESDGGAAITARSWVINAGPAGVGTTIGTSAALSWTPTTVGSYTLRYSATNSVGTTFDDVIVTVTAIAPTVNAGPDTSTAVNQVFVRTATENANGAAITARSWVINAGPTGVGTSIGTAAALSWTPTVTGSYTLRYSATNSVGTNFDDAIVTVTAVAPSGPEPGRFLIAY